MYKNNFYLYSYYFYFFSNIMFEIWFKMYANTPVEIKAIQLTNKVSSLF